MKHGTAPVTTSWFGLAVQAQTRAEHAHAETENLCHPSVSRPAHTHTHTHVAKQETA